MQPTFVAGDTQMLMHRTHTQKCYCCGCLVGLDHHHHHQSEREEILISVQIQMQSKQPREWERKKERRYSVSASIPASVWWTWHSFFFFQKMNKQTNKILFRRNNDIERKILDVGNGYVAWSLDNILLLYRHNQLIHPYILCIKWECRRLFL